jgi:hypothetical protein
LCSCDRNSKLMSKKVRQLFLPAPGINGTIAHPPAQEQSSVVGRTIFRQVLKSPIIDEMIEEGAIRSDDHLVHVVKHEH